ncbi:MAG: hypothetical protein JJU20_12685 [Opitutales bacterium]|nr:hypothetical protein [Opitutales bacterium]
MKPLNTLSSRLPSQVALTRCLHILCCILTGALAATLSASDIPDYTDDLDFQAALPAPDRGAFRVVRTFDTDTNSYPLFSPDGTRVLMGNQKVFDVKTGEEVASFNHSPAWGSSRRGFSTDGRYLSFADSDKLSVWNVETGELESEFTINNLQRIEGPYAFSSAHPAHTVNVFDARTGSRISVFEGSRGLGDGLALSEDLRWIAYEANEQVKVWDIPTGKDIYTFRMASGEWPRSFYFSRNREYLAVGASTPTGRGSPTQVMRYTAWHLPSQQRVVSVRIPYPAMFRFSPDDRYLMLSTSHSIDPFKETKIFRLNGENQAQEIHSVRSQAGLFTPNSRYAILFHQHPDNVMWRSKPEHKDFQEVFDLENGEVLMQLVADDPKLGGRYAAYSPDGRYAIRDGRSELQEIAFFGGRARIGDDIIDWDRPGEEPDQWPRLVPDIQIRPTSPSRDDGKIELQLSVSNQGQGPAYGLGAFMHTEPENLFHTERYPIFIGNIPPGQSVDRKLLLPVSEAMLSGPVRYRFEFFDVYRAAPRDLHIEHSLFSEEPLPLELNLSWQNDQGEENGPLFPGEMVDLQFQVNNLSSESEAELEIAFILPHDRDLSFLGEDQFSLSSVNPGDVENRILQLGIRPRFNKDQIDLSAIVLDRASNRQIRQTFDIPVKLE